jgi:putative intracellular protease/amidase
MPILIRSVADLPAPPPAGVAGKRVLMLVAPAGHCVHEVVRPMVALQRAGVHVDLASSIAGPIAFEWTGTWMAFAAAPWSDTRQLARLARDAGLFDRVRAVASLGPLDHYDAVILPGGHGQTFAAFVLGALVGDVLHQFAGSGRVTALICHGVAAAGLPGGGGEPPLAAGRHVTAWPRAFERPMAAIPFLGEFLAPLGRLTQDYVEPIAAAVHCSGRPWGMPHAVIDGTLVTGWGPWSADCVARAVLTAIAGRCQAAPCSSQSEAALAS